MTTASSRVGGGHLRPENSKRQSNRAPAVAGKSPTNRTSTGDALQAPAFLRLDRARLDAGDHDSRIEGFGVEGPAEALDVVPDSGAGDGDVEGHRRTRPGDASAPDRFRDVRTRAERLRRELDLAFGIDDENERADEGLLHDLGRAVGHQTADPHTTDRDAKRDRGGSRRRRRRNRGLSRWWLRRRRACSRRRIGGLRRCPRPGRGCDGERGRKPNECEGRKQPHTDRSHPDSHVSSVDAKMRGSLLTTASTPASSTRARSCGSSTVHATTAAPRLCARRTVAGLTREW